MDLSTLLKDLDPARMRMCGLLFLGLGVLTLAMAAFDRATGVTSREGGFELQREIIREEENPARFHRTIRVSIVGSITCFVIGVVCLLMG